MKNNDDQFLEFLNIKSRKKVGSRERFQEMNEWIENNPEKFLGFIRELNEALNLLRFSDEKNTDPTVYKNTVDLARYSSKNDLPDLFSLINNPDVDNQVSFVRSLRRLNVLMERGENKSESRHIGFHLEEENSKDPDPTETRVAGMLIHGLEEFLLEKFPLLPVKVLEYAIEESLSRIGGSKLWEIVVDRTRLNWVDGYDGFSEEFRQHVGVM